MEFLRPIFGIFAHFQLATMFVCHLQKNRKSVYCSLSGFVFHSPNSSFCIVFQNTVQKKFNLKRGTVQKKFNLKRDTEQKKFNFYNYGLKYVQIRAFKI